MKTRELKRNDSDFFTLLAIGATIALLAISTLASGQEAIKLPSRQHRLSNETFKNVQGFALPSTVPDSTRVYQIEGSKSKFYFRRSANTGKLYKVYLKKDSIALVPETSNK
jgi:hypothetical protein